MTRFSLALEQWLFDEYRVPPSGFGLFRILFALVFLLVRMPDGLWIADMPGAFLDPPPGLTYLARSVPPAWFFALVNFAGVAAGCALLVGWHTRLCSFMVTSVTLALNAWSYSFGKINHDILFVLLPSFMALAGWGASYSLDARKSPVRPPYPYRAWTMALWALAVSLAMLSAAIPKAASGWLSPETHAVKWFIVFMAEARERANAITLASLDRLPSLAWEFADVTTVALEAAFVLCVVRRRWFQVACAIATIFHFGVAVLMEITFVSNLLAYAAFLDWWRIERMAWMQALISHAEKGAGVFRPQTALPAACAIAGVYVWWGNPVRRLLLPLTSDPSKALEFGICMVGIVVGVFFLASLLSRMIAERGSPKTGSEIPSVQASD